MSSLPSLLKSPTATDTGRTPVLLLLGARNVPLPLPSRTLTSLELLLAVTRSILPSALKSPTASEIGKLPVAEL